MAARSTESSRPAGDIKLVGLVSAAHFISHFYQLVLPPIFPLLTASFGVGYAKLGLIITLMYATSGLLQTPAGMLVDRLGSARVLIGGLALYSTAVLLSGFVPGVWWLAPLAIAGGLGNCVFHPADYAIMTVRVGASRLGRAYGAHTLAGNLGWVAAPVAVLSLTAAFGWRAALVILGGAGLLFTACLVSQRAVLSAGPGPGGRAAAPQRAAPQRAPPPAGVLLSGPIVLCFIYFTLLSVSQVGLQTFLPSALVAAFGMSIAAANGMLTAFLLASSLGILCGGIIADRFARHERIVAAGLALAALLSLAFAVAVLPILALMAIAGAAGFALGCTIPARDMLVRGATPEGATGKVFGFVYSGLDLGSTLTPPFLGLLLDHQRPRLIFVVAAAALFLAIGTAVVVGNDAAGTGRRSATVAKPTVRA